MTVDFGTDLSCQQDFTPLMTSVSGVMCLIEALIRRLETPRGTLIGDSDYGYYVTGEIDDDVDQADIARIAALIDAEFLKDQRVLATATAASFASGVLITTSKITTAAGPFSLVLTIAETVQLARVNQ